MVKKSRATMHILLRLLRLQLVILRFVIFRFGEHLAIVKVKGTRASLLLSFDGTRQICSLCVNGLCVNGLCVLLACSCIGRLDQPVPVVFCQYP